MSLFIDQKSLSPSGKLMILRVRVYTFLGSLLYEKDIKVIAKKTIEKSFKQVSKEIFSNVNEWKVTNNGHTFALDEYTTAFIYEKGQVPKGGRPKKKQDVEDKIVDNIEVVDEAEN